MRRIAALALTFAAAASASAQAPSGRFVVGDQVFGTLQQAVDAIGDGEGTIHIPPGTYRDCAVQEKGRIAFVADKPGSVIFTRVTCEDKAALVLRGRGAPSASRWVGAAFSTAAGVTCIIVGVLL